LQDLPSLLPPSTKINFPDPDKLHEFRIVVSPEEGYWAGGKFTFSVSVTEEYNFAVRIHYNSAFKMNYKLHCCFK